MSQTDHLSPEDRAALDALRCRLRSRAERMVDCVEALQDPETLNDAWRGVRLIRQADAMVCQLYTPAESVMRPAALRRMAAPAATPAPVSPVKGPWRMEMEKIVKRIETEGLEVEAEAEFTLEPAPRPVVEHISELEPQPALVPVPANRTTRDEVAERFASNTAELMANIDAAARYAGFWPNGQTVRPEQPAPTRHDDPRLAQTAPVSDGQVPAGDALRLWVHVRFLNMCTHHRARHDGHWPDGSAYAPEVVDYGYWTLSRGETQRLPGEYEGPPGLPWWMVRVPPD